MNIFTAAAYGYALCAIQWGPIFMDHAPNTAKWFIVVGCFVGIVGAVAEIVMINKYRNK
jgi:F0F1-type ATP synthase assembly protein I